MSTELNDNKTFNLYANSTILLFGFVIILYIIRKNNRNVRDEESYDWTKFTIMTENKGKYKKHEKGDKAKVRVKDMSKGTGFVKDEHKFVATQEDIKPNANFLNIDLFITTLLIDNKICFDCIGKQSLVFYLINYSI